MEYAIEIKKLKKSYGKNVALSGISFNVKKGSIMGFLGRNGAGKTTTIRILMGLLKKDDGEVRVANKKLEGDLSQLRMKIGYMPENFSLYLDMTGREVLKFNSKFFKRMNEEKVLEYSKAFKLDLRKKIKSLSKGMKQAMSFAVATSTDPEILILDEPLSGLDPVMREKMLKFISKECADNGATIFYSSHILEDVEKIADTVCIIDEGKDVFAGELDEIKEKRKKIVVTFKENEKEVTVEELENLNGILKAERSGHGFVLDIYGNIDEILSHLENMKAESVEVLDMNLSDIFMDLVEEDEEK